MIYVDIFAGLVIIVIILYNIFKNKKPSNLTSGNRELAEEALNKYNQRNQRK